MSITLSSRAAVVTPVREVDGGPHNDTRMPSRDHPERSGGSGPAVDYSGSIRSEIAHLQIARRKVSQELDAVSAADTAITEIHSTLRRLRSLVVQSIPESLKDADRAALTLEAQRLITQVSLLAIGGERADASAERGEPGSPAAYLSDVDAQGLGLSQLQLGSPAKSRSSLDHVDRALEVVSEQQWVLQEIDRSLRASLDALGQHGSIDSQPLVDPEEAANVAVEARRLILSDPDRGLGVQVGAARSADLVL